jgi:hypothetical protein
VQGILTVVANILSITTAKRSSGRLRKDSHVANISSDTIHGFVSPPTRYDGLIDQYVYDILNTLRGSSEIQVDLPNMWSDAEAGVAKPYTATFLTQLYIQCYENQLWYLCDLVADTWIRAFQKANKRNRDGEIPLNYMWRRNSALLKKFREGKKGFKVDVNDYGLDVQDPDLDSDVTDFDTARLHQLFNHTAPNCGARLLWADAMALCGKNMETNIVRRPGAWPKELFYDVMCTSLRMVGRKLTLKIEERYEGAWCRYHEHVKHGLPCYRELAWKQKDEREEEDDDENEDNVKLDVAGGEKRDYEAVGGYEQRGSKRVQFDAGDVVDFDDIDAEGESEEG